MEREATLSFLYPWRAVDDHLKIPKAPEGDTKDIWERGSPWVLGTSTRERHIRSMQPMNRTAVKFWEGAVASQRTIDVCECILEGYRTGSIWSSQPSEHQGKSRLRSRCPDSTPPQPSTPCWQVWQQPQWLDSPLPTGTKTKQGEGERRRRNLNCDSVVTQDGLEITEFNWLYPKIITLTFL